MGQDSGYRKHKVIDNYIHSVVKTEEEMKSLWLENRLTIPARTGTRLSQQSLIARAKVSTIRS